MHEVSAGKRKGVPHAGPTAAERARSIAYGIAGAVLVAPGVPYDPVPAHTTGENGAPLLLMPRQSPVVVGLTAVSDLPATLRISDLAPVPFADRVRGRAWLHGWVSEVPPDGRRDAADRLARLHPRPELLDLAISDGPGTFEVPAAFEDLSSSGGSAGSDWTILTMDLAEIEIADGWGAADLEPEEYRDAWPDPFTAVEPAMLRHLDGAHRAELARLVPGAEPGEVRPVALDRYGLWLRTPDGDHRVDFGVPARDVDGLRRAYRHLFASAGVRGM
ncbi:DUF2470 domain-containing protein [Actinomadura rupiterrae]|uniref:DUF2470 domain-containing protein n=1 Tax=Actinomadura rupiterrae TaxID=559627 RepID=UPI0020A2434E|nr:DUF2470 domain-containing protein [Actinomadura rupiterrae]MCP2334769.1 hypothetical protein [Actinomadura rupiterrae]